MERCRLYLARLRPEEAGGPELPPPRRGFHKERVARRPKRARGSLASVSGCAHEEHRISEGTDRWESSRPGCPG